ncbi:hypothetical protein [Halosolutus gelatinilyticus]|uniref:hypothetical protein n=1 Tax=Halosolutus gelatinilyticus TaxID=2931975 RepID=UPI001FF3EDC9|nr:hypothetical protein [Halosolutus gelatinilyticus]
MGADQTVDERIESLSPTEQTVLLGVAALDRDDDTPAQTHELRRLCTEQLTDVEMIVGSLSEADVIRSLYRLEAEGMIDEVDPAEKSPTGKGRPAYTLPHSPDAILEAIDDELTDAIDTP